MTRPPAGVTFVVPVHDGARWLDRVLTAILAQHDGRPMEVLAVDDGSTDTSAAILARYAADGTVRVLAGAGRGAAAAINAGIRHAAYPIVCQVDQDVILEPGWLGAITAAFAEDDVAAVQGYYATPRDGSVWARVMGLDLEQRYAAISGDSLDHVCTGNSAYRADALRKVGLFGESLGYGYDNDLSYRLGAAGYRLTFCRAARSVHRWRESLVGYLVQQYGVGYGRLDVIAKHPKRLTGDDVSGLGMIAHAAGMLIALALLSVSGVAALLALNAKGFAIGGAILVALLTMERVVAGVRATRRHGDAAGLLFGVVHLARDAVWALAVVMWAVHRVTGARGPWRSMRRHARWSDI